jgi:hypothetical protein
MLRTWIVVGLIAGVALAAVLVLWPPAPSPAEQPPAAAAPAARTVTPSLPLAQIILFSSGLGYFQREGSVEGNARVDLTFPVTDVNDLLKSLVLQDLGNGRINVVSYDSHEPLDRTLKSFALDLTWNPTVGQLLNQARGEKIEVTLQQSAATSPSVLSGIIIGMEAQRQPQGKDQVLEADVLNLLCGEGVRSVALAQVQRLRFLNPVVESEFRKALEVLAGAHDIQKRTISIGFTGDGKRPVRVGYVVENPLWKMSYRLVVDGNDRPTLQGWAVVENTTSEDWKDVRMALIASRPFAFQMNLYEPLYLPRPVVEPAQFAVLRSPPAAGGQDGGQPGTQGGGNFGAAVNRYQPGFVPGGAQAGFGGNFNGFNGNFNGFGGQLGGAQFGLQGGLNVAGGFGGLGNVNLGGGPPNAPAPAARPTYEEVQARREKQREEREQARKEGSAITGLDATDGTAAVASTEEVGDALEYVLDQRVTLPRQKSAMLPVVAKEVPGTRVSLFNPTVYPRSPLLAVRLKNTTGARLMEGPVAVYEGGVYTGDARLPDLPDGEERFLTYAVDQGTEVRTTRTTEDPHSTSLRIVKGLVHAEILRHDTTAYFIKNRSQRERIVVLEKEVGDGWTIIQPAGVARDGKRRHRFEVKVQPGKVTEYTVVAEERTSKESRLTVGENFLAWLPGPLEKMSAPIQEAARKINEYQGRLKEMADGLAKLDEEYRTLWAEQIRLKGNLDRLPMISAAYRRNVELIDAQEPNLEKALARWNEQKKQEAALHREYADYLAALTAE